MSFARSRWLAAALLVSGVAGCASLHTDIRAFDGSCLDDSALARQVALARNEVVLELIATKAFAEGKADVMQAARTAVEDAREAGKLTDGDDGSDLLAELEGYLGKLDEARSLNQAGAEGVEAGEYREAVNSFEQANVLVRIAEGNISAALEVYAGKVSLEELDSSLKRTVEKLGGDPLFEDPLIDMVVYATDPSRASKPARSKRAKTARAHRRRSEACWTAVVDETRTAAWGGNSDIAVKMQDDGTFTVKGLRLDASKVTQALFELSTSAVCLAASIYGVGSCSSKEDEGASTGSSPATEAASAKASVQLRKRAALQMLEVVIEAGTGLDEGNKTKRAERVEATVDAYSSQLETTDAKADK